MMPLSRLRLSLTLAAMLVGLAGCYVPAPAAHVVLEVSTSGGYVLDGHALTAVELPAALAAASARSSALVVEIHAPSQVSVDAINTAVHAVRLAHARVAFASRG
jgi:hypothetical protein